MIKYTYPAAMVASRCRFAQRLRHAGTTFRDFVPISLSGLFLRVACLTGTHICATSAMVASRCRFAQRSRHAGTTFRDFVPISLSGLFLRVACLTGTHICATLAPRWHNVGAVLAPYSSRWRHAGCVRRRHVGFETHIYATLAPRWHNVGASVVPNLLAPTVENRILCFGTPRFFGLFFWTVENRFFFGTPRFFGLFFGQ